MITKAKIEANQNRGKRGWCLISYEFGKCRAFDEDGNTVSIEFPSVCQKLVKIDRQVMRVEKCEYDGALLTFTCNAVSDSEATDFDHKWEG